MSDTRRHPDLFTAAEALEYLHLPADKTRALEHLRGKDLLTGYQLGPELMYHRDDLDACVAVIFRKVPAKSGKGAGPHIKFGG